MSAYFLVWEKLSNKSTKIGSKIDWIGIHHHRPLMLTTKRFSKNLLVQSYRSQSNWSSCILILLLLGLVVFHSQKIYNKSTKIDLKINKVAIHHRNSYISTTEVSSKNPRPRVCSTYSNKPWCILMLFVVAGAVSDSKNY